VADALVRMEGVGKVFAAETVFTHALSAIDLEIRRGEFVSIAGPSGCGKTTLLSILGLLDAPSSGSYSLDGRAVHELSALLRARLRRELVGFIFQSFHLLGELSVQENVELPLSYRGVALPERRRLAAQALEAVGLAHRARHMPSQLSGGQQQRVAFARATVGRPALLLADEPTGNLDSENGARIMALLSDLHRSGTTLCVVTHDPRYAGLAQRTLHLLDGALRGSSIRDGSAA
jgi:putative ABC transport system ATP-binding protein